MRGRPMLPKANFGFASLPDPSLTSIVDPDKIIRLVRHDFAIPLDDQNLNNGRMGT
jgi:hypothetical protein